LLPTLGFILLAYGIYALITFWSRRQGGKYRGRSRARRYGWLTFAGSTAVGLGLVLWVSLSPEQRGQNLKFAGFLGSMGWADGWAGQKTDRPLESLPIKSQGPGDQPAYASLHPETPAEQLGPEKKPLPPRPLRKPKLQKLPKSQAKGGKVATSAAKKDKASSKSASKKKKPPPSPGSQKSAGG
jgi:hypothetical protein